MKNTEKKRVVVVGGSIAGLSCAHALLRSSQWLEVVVFEKALSVTAAGAGLGLDTGACDALREWGLGDALEASTLPLSVEEVQFFDTLFVLSIVLRGLYSLCRGISLAQHSLGRPCDTLELAMMPSILGIHDAHSPNLYVKIH